MDLNVHLNVSRIWKILGSINDNMFDISLIIVLVVRKWICWKSPFMHMVLQHRHTLQWNVWISISSVHFLLLQGFILVIVDTFTRWVELYHTTDATALSAAECLLKHFGRFGAPHQLRSDNGPRFIADVIREFLHLIVVLYCTYMHPYIYTVSRTAVQLLHRM